MFTFLLIVHAIVATALVTVILMQRSEGGGLASGGSPSGLMSARGAADFLTRTTTILASIFVLLSIGLAALATVQRAPREIDTSLAREAQPVAPASDVPLAGDPLSAAAGAASEATPPPAATPAPVVTPAPAPAPKAAPREKAAEKAPPAPAPAKAAEEPVLKLNPRPATPAGNESSVPLAQ